MPKSILNRYTEDYEQSKKRVLEWKTHGSQKQIIKAWKLINKLSEEKNLLLKSMHEIISLFNKKLQTAKIIWRTRIFKIQRKFKCGWL